MFGFGISQELKELGDKIGRIFHHQLTEAIMLKGEIFNTPEEIVFTSGYLKAYFHQMFILNAKTDSRTEAKLFKKACDGALPRELWKVYVRGEELANMSEGSKNSTMRHIDQLYEQALGAGYNDANETGNSDALPSRLAKYLSGKS